MHFGNTRYDYATPDALKDEEAHAGAKRALFHNPVHPCTTLKRRTPTHPPPRGTHRGHAVAPLHAAPAPVPRRTRARVFAAFQIAAAKTTAKTLRYGLESRKEKPAKPRTAKLPASRSARRVAARQDWQDRLAAVGADTVDARQWTRQYGHPHLQGLFSVRVCCGDERRACRAARGGAPPLWLLHLMLLSRLLAVAVHWRG